MINQFFCHPEFSAFCLLSGLFYEKNNRQLAEKQLVAYLQGHPSRQFQQWNARGGIQALQQFGFQDQQWGVSAGIQAKTKMKINLGFNLIYRKAFKGNVADQVLGNFSTNYTF